MFWMVSPPIIRRSYHCIYSACHYWDHYCHLSWTSLSRQVTITVSLMPDTVDTVIWVADDGWRYHPKHVEQFEYINKMYIAASCLIIIDIYYAMHGPLNIKYIILFTIKHNLRIYYFVILYSFLEWDIRPDNGLERKAETCSHFKLHLVNKIIYSQVVFDSVYLFL